MGGRVLRLPLSRAHKQERPLHVHRHRDDLQMTGVAGESQIADAAHSIPALYRGEGALDGWSARAPPRTSRTPHRAGDEGRGGGTRRGSGRSVWVFLAPGRLAAKTPAHESWIGLDFLGFLRPNLDFSMGYED
jgi:hypothetical protein